MEAASPQLASALLRAEPSLALLPAPAPPEPCTAAELRALVHAGETESDACERLLAQLARLEGALYVEIGDGLAGLTVGERLISLGFSSLGDYAREILDIKERTAEAMAHLSRELRSRPLLRAAVRAGEVRIRNAQTVLPVAVGDDEADWVERARLETVRVLEKAVRAARAGEEDDEWTRFRVRLSTEERATVDEALAIAGKLLPGSRQPQRLEAMA
ncbi:MAG TPA: HNH endonuclease, partial [Anaeromyxobacter sp.]